MPKVQFAPAGLEIEAAEGWTILEAAQACGVEINIPCGGQGRCGRCAVVVADGNGRVRRRSTMRLSAADIAAGYALACQSVVLGDLAVTVPPQEEIARHLVTEKAAVAIQPPAGYNIADQPLLALFLALDPPDLGDQTDDWSRVQAALSRAQARRPGPGRGRGRKRGAACNQGPVTTVIGADRQHFEGAPRRVA